MRDRIEQTFAAARSANRGALMPYLTAGDPDLARTAVLLQTLQEAGADLVELGIPYSDPLADGPVIQAASARALAAGTRLGAIARMIAFYRAGGGTLPLVMMTCYNPILQYGPETFARDFSEAGADGVLITDLPPAESEEWCAIAGTAGLATVFLVAPTTPLERIHLATERTTGFVYAVSRAGVTGARTDLPPDLEQLVINIRCNTTLPVAVGFGISSPEHVRTVCHLADGAIVGSALVKLIEQYGESDELADRVAAFTRELAGGRARQ